VPRPQESATDDTDVMDDPSGSVPSVSSVADFLAGQIALLSHRDRLAALQAKGLDEEDRHRGACDSTAGAVDIRAAASGDSLGDQLLNEVAEEITRHIIEVHRMHATHAARRRRHEG